MRCDVGGASGHVTIKPARPKARGFCRSLPLSMALERSEACTMPASKASLYWRNEPPHNGFWKPISKPASTASVMNDC